MSVNSAVSCSRDLRARLDGETCLLIQYSILRAFFSSSSLNPYFFLSRLQLTFACLRRCGEHRRATMCLNGTSVSECNEGRRRSRQATDERGQCCYMLYAAIFNLFHFSFSSLLHTFLFLGFLLFLLIYSILAKLFFYHFKIIFLPYIFATIPKDILHAMLQLHYAITIILRSYS